MSARIFDFFAEHMLRRCSVEQIVEHIELMRAFERFRRMQIAKLPLDEQQAALKDLYEFIDPHGTDRSFKP